jgi:hypothetical protein
MILGISCSRSLADPSCGDLARERAQRNRVDDEHQRKPEIAASQLEGSISLQMPSLSQRAAVS